MALAHPSNRPPRQARNEKRGPKHCRPMLTTTTLFEDVLSEDLEVGAYLIDGMAEALVIAGVRVTNQGEFVRELRKSVNSAARSAKFFAAEHSIYYPAGLSETKRLLQDLPKIKKLLERNENLESDTLRATTKRLRPIRRPRLKDQPDEISNLVTAMWRASKAITVFLNTFKPYGRPGNHDPLTRRFIDRVFNFWAQLLWLERPPDEGRLFVRLIAAAWRDLQFPTKDESGVSLEEWLADRVRKQFPDGIRNACIRHQEEERARYEAWLGLSTPPN